MLLKVCIMLLLLHRTFVTTEPMIIYNCAWFDISSTNYLLANQSSVTTLNMCKCRCYNNLLCITGTYFGMNQTCILFSASLSQGQLQPTIDMFATVFSFPNRTTSINSISSPAIIEWLFNNNLDDVYGRYNGHLTDKKGNSIEYYATMWSSPGYAGYGSAVNFPTNLYSVVNQYLDLITTSFTVTAWIMLPSDFNSVDAVFYYFTLFSHCETLKTDKCLHLVITNSQLYFGFYDDDLTGNTLLNLKQWYHVTYVYDRSASKQLVYLNGQPDGSQSPQGYYRGNASQIVIGALPSLSSGTSYSGIIDKLTFVSRVKNATEILDEATLVAYYPFDGAYTDSGPNHINNISSVSTAFTTDGRFNQALLIDSPTLSYFQTAGFYYLGQSDYSYSFSLWIYPFVNAGTILQVKSSNGWAVPMIGFNKKGALTIQTLSKNGIYTTSYDMSSTSLNPWTHISMTYSSTNGIRLYVAGFLVSNNNVYTDYAASGEMSSIIIGSGVYGMTSDLDRATIILTSQYQGQIDELKIFSRELSSIEVYQLAGGSLSSPA